MVEVKVEERSSFFDGSVDETDVTLVQVLRNQLDK